MTQTTGMNAMAQLAGEFTEAAVLGHATALRLLYAEMQALTQVLPGRAQTEVAQRAEAAEIEAEFDNMPV